MFNLLRSMAITNLRKNRALYVPFALATVMVTVVLYVTNALAATPEFAHLEGGSAMAKTLSFGFVIVQVVSLVVVLYANAFVVFSVLTVRIFNCSALLSYLSLPL